MNLKKGILRRLKGSDYIYEQFNIEEARSIGVKVGNNCRFIDTAKASFSTEPFLITIGNHVSMTNPQFVTHDGGVWVFRKKYPEIDLFGKIEIGNNCFIGIGATFLPNTKIGNNCIVAAGAMVKGQFEDNSVIGGIPAKKLGSIDTYFEKNKERFTYFKNEKSIAKKSKIINHLSQVNK